MSENQKRNENDNLNNIGDQIRDVVQDALESGDFKQLNEMVAGTVNSALAEAKKQVKAATGQIKDVGRDVAEEFKKKTTYDNQRQPGADGNQNSQGWTSDGKAGWAAEKTGWNPGGWGNKFGQQGNGWNGAEKSPWTPRQVKDTFHYNRSRSRNRNKVRYAPNPEGQAYQSGEGNPNGWEGRPKNLPMVKFNKVGRVAGVLNIVFGSIGTGLATIGLGVLGILLMADVLNVLWPLAIPGGLLLLFVNMIQRGCVQKDRIKRAERYLQICAGKMYVNLEELASHIGEKKKTIRKDLRKMLRIGMFPEGHLDQEGDCLMLDDLTYRQYLDIQRDKSQLDREQKQTVKAQETPVQEAAHQETPAVNQELEDMIAQGKEFIKRLRDMNDAIECEVISSKLFQLENLLKEIFDRVREHPEQMSQMQKFMDYYLPTTIKLVQAYSEFDTISVPGENILTAKAEIEKTLDTINKAFAELLNNLFRDTVFDVTTDAQVLQSMLAREGLTKEMEFAGRNL